MWTDKVRELVDQTFANVKPSVKDCIEDLQWADDRMGAGFVKIVWDGEYHPADDTMPQDQTQQAVEVEHAQAENIDPVSAKVADGDIDKIHLFVHNQAIEAMPPGPLADALARHADAHESRMLVVDSEGPKLRVLETNQFIYDTDVPWQERAWTAELRSLRIQELIESGYKNVNLENCPPEEREEEIDLAYEDLTARAWDIHDRRTGERRIISVDGPEDGLFLHKGPWPYGSIDVYQVLISRPRGKGRLYGAATAKLALPILDRLAEVDFWIDRHVRSHPNTQILAPAGAMTTKAKSQIGNPDVRIVEMPPEAMAGIKEVTQPPIPDTLLKQREILLNELRRVIGMDAQDTGANNPHQITATESSNRSEASAGRKDSRQDRIADLLSGIAAAFLGLYHKFGTKRIWTKMLSPEGVTFEALNPSDIPEEIGLLFDVAGQTPNQQAQDRQAAIAVETYLSKGVYQADQQKFGEWFMRKMGVKNPEQFRLAMAQPMPGAAPGGAMPSMAGVPNNAAPQPGAMPQPAQPTTMPKPSMN